MGTDLAYSPFELMAVAGARELKDGEIIGVGLGLPVVSSFLAKRTHAPNATILFELGVVDPEPMTQGSGTGPKSTPALPICWARYCTKVWWMWAF